MKKIVFFLLLIFAIAKIFGQDYKIDFAASIASNGVDSVKVENITQCTSLSLRGADTLHLLGSNGLNELKSNPNHVCIYPNPSEANFFINIDIKGKTNVSTVIYNIKGELILEKYDFLLEGKHSYQLNGLCKGVYVVNIKVGLTNFSTKIISNNYNKYNKANISKIDIIPNHQFIEIVKSRNAKKQKETITSNIMQYTTGDRLKFTAYSGGGKYATIIVIVPTQSQTLSFNFIPCTDMDGNHYSVVQIGTQWWMAENLKTTKYNNGDIIPNITNSTSWRNLTTGAYCNYNNDINKVAIYGRLYNWFAIDDSRNIAPLGWRVPSFAEWQALSDYYGGNNISGGKLKANCTSFWSNPNTSANNESGFSGLGSGFRDANAVFMEQGAWVVWWYSTSMNPTTAYSLVLWNNDDDFGQHYASKVVGASVRCIKD